MKKKKRKGYSIDAYLSDDNVIEMNIGDYNQAGEHLFGANVTRARAIPDIMDGLKPIGRRTLYAMFAISKATKERVKVLSLTGDVIKIHPHGDTSAEDCITEFSKPWANIYTLTDIDSNNGSPKGNAAASGRYIEACLTPYCIDCFFAEWDPHIAELKNSYNPQLMEPQYLIARYPNMLLRVCTGFTFSLATSIPSYNLEEAFNAVIQLIKNPDYKPLLYPDLPSGCAIIDDGTFQDICDTGVGKFRMRGEITIDEDTHSLIIESLPFQVKLDRIINKIYEMHNAKEIPGLIDMYDNSSIDGIEYHLKFSNVVDLQYIRNFLYKKTDLESTFGVQMVYIDNGEVRLFSLKEVMQHWIDNRRIVKHRYYNYKLIALRERNHVLEVLIDIVSDEAKCVKLIKKIRKCKRKEVIVHLMDIYDISDLQAKEIASMPTSRFSETDLSEYRIELADNLDLIERYEKYIHNPKKIDKIIIRELEDAIGKYNKPRRSRIIKASKENEILANKEYLVLFTKNGFVKKLSVDSRSIGNLNNDDDPINIIKVSNKDEIVFFDKKGMIHCVKVDDIPPSDLKNKGVTISRYAKVKGEIIQVVAKSKITENGSFVLVTKRGLIKRTECSKFAFKSSVVAATLKGNDELVSVIYTEHNTDVVIFTKKGMGVRFGTDTFEPTTRISAGVIGINLDDNDEVIGLTTVSKDDTDLTMLTTKCNGKRCTLESFESQPRRGEVLKLISLLPGEELFQIYSSNDKSKFVIVTKVEYIPVDASDFAVLTRNHCGKKVISLTRGDVIVKFNKVV